MRSAHLTLVMVLMSGCSLVVPGNGGLTPDLVDGGSVQTPDAGPARDARTDAPMTEPDAGLQCEPGLTACGASCVDTSTDTANCGGCGMRCAPTDVCREGSCYDPAVEVAVGTNHTCVRRASGALWCWGRNETGQLGTGDFADTAVPRAVQEVDDAVSLSSAGFSFGGFPGVNCATRSSGEVWCWGTNFNGQVGDRTTEPRNRPTRVVDVTMSVGAETGYYGSCALRTRAPYVSCWGRQLGTETANPVPQAVGGLPTSAVGFRQLAMGLLHACALDSAGTVWCWGNNGAGQLGDPELTTRTFARAVSGLPPVEEIAAGFVHTCARERSGQVWCWGNSQELGMGMTETMAIPSPREVPGLNDAVRLASAPFGPNTCAVRADGTLWCWGRDPLDPAAHLPSPVEVSTPSPVRDVAPGSLHSCVVLATGDVACFGSNQFGQLGDGTMEDRAELVTAQLP